jgi:hypothetical protein
MPPVLAYARVPEVDLLAAYDEHCGRLGLISVNLGSAARTFLRRWPDPQRWAGEPLETRLTVSHPTRSFVTFLMLAGYLRPGYDYLIRRKLAVFWRHLPPGPLAEDLARFLGAAQELGFTERTRSAAASQVIGRLLIQTGRDSREACHRQERRASTHFKFHSVPDAFGRSSIRQLHRTVQRQGRRQGVPHPIPMRRLWFLSTGSLLHTNHRGAHQLAKRRS